jgi:hypothetical protein
VKSDLADVGIVVEADSGAVVRLIGEVDCATAPRLREELIGLSNRGIRAVTVDPVPSTSSTGQAWACSSRPSSASVSTAVTWSSVSKAGRQGGAGDHRPDEGLRRQLKCSMSPPWQTDDTTVVNRLR